MERGESTEFILKQFRKKTRRIINKDLFTEFFYLNRHRKVVEFLHHNKSPAMQIFLQEFLPSQFKSFVTLRILNDVEESISTWYYEEENITLSIAVNWGFKKQEISIDIDIENFMVTIIDDKENVIKSIDYVMLNDYIISFLTLQARNLAQTFEALSMRRN